MMAGFLIAVGWFTLLGAAASFLTEQCGMVARYAYPCALLIASAAATVAILICFGLNWSGWIALGTAFLYLCLWMSGGL